MLQTPVAKLILSLAAPTVASQLISIIYNTADTYFVSQISTSASAAVGVVFSLQSIIQAYGFGVAMGAGSLISLRLGEKKDRDANMYATSGFLAEFVGGLLMLVFGLLYLEPLIRVLGATETMLPHACAYGRIILMGAPIMCGSFILNCILRAEGAAVVSMVGLCAGGLINIALDPLFIFTFKMGVQGSSLATILSQLCSCIWIVCFFFSRKSLFRFQASLLGLSPGRIFSILSLGFTPFIMTLTECAIQIVFNINLNRATGGNKDYTAALTVMLSALQLISLPLNGLGNGMQPFVSYNYGKADSARLKQGIKYVTIIAFIYVVCIWSVSMAFPVVYARLFSASEAVTQIVMRYTPMFLMGSIMFFVQMTLQNVNVGLGQAKEALLLAVNRKVVILIPLCFALTHFLGFKGVYLSEGIADLVAGIVTAIVIFTSFPKIFRRREEEVKQAASN